MMNRLRYLDNDLWLWAKVNGTARWDLRRARSELRARPDMFADVTSYCAFVGHQRSGHSVVGSILDAHPSALISHRLDALKYVSMGCRPDELFYMIARNSQRFARSGRHLTAYSYALPGQGTAGSLTLIGDQEGQHTSRRLLRQPDMLSRFFSGRSVRLSFVHVIRNPFDNIATIANRTQRMLPWAIKEYFELCRGVVAVRKAYGEASVLDLYHENLVTDPQGEIVRLCSFLQLPVDGTWVRRCAEVVYREPNHSRSTRAWTEADVQAVRAGVAAFGHLARYRSDGLEAAR